MSERRSDPLITPPTNTTEVAQSVALCIDGLAPSPLSNYMDTPATVFRQDHAGRSMPYEAGYSRGEEVKSNLEHAISEASEGRVGVAPIIGGSVNGHYNVGHSTMPNLRTAFEHLDELFQATPLRGSTKFHELFSGFKPEQADSSMGYVFAGVQPGSAEEAQVVQAARITQEAGRPTRYIDENGKPDGKLIPLLDTVSGAVMPNVFLQVHGSIYADEQGTASAFSNMVFANLIVLPDRLIESYENQDKAFEAHAVPDAEAVHYIKDGLPKSSILGGDRQGGEFADTVMRSAIVERQNTDGTSEAITHLIFTGGSVMGVVRELDADNRLTESRLVLLPIGQHSPAYDEGHVTATTLLRLDASALSEPAKDRRVVTKYETAKLGRADLAEVYGIRDSFVSARQMEVDLTADSERVYVRDTHSANGTGVMTSHTLMRTGSDGMQGLARESALALCDVLQKQPEIWAKAS